jgi:hypothetical protein
MPTCSVCGATFGTDDYHVAAGGRLYDSVECALRRAASERRRVDVMTVWLEAGRRRLGIDDGTTNVEWKPPDH